MAFGRLAGLGVAMAAACGMAQGQAPPPNYPAAKPSYEQALSAVTEAGCERKEAPTYLRFVCEEGQAVWYFTQPGRPEYPGYTAMPSYRVVLPRGTKLPEAARWSWSIRTLSQAAEADREAYVAWTREILKVWIASVPEVWPGPKGHRGEFRPLDPP